MQIKYVVLISFFFIAINSQPLPDLDFSINQLVGSWVLGGANGFGYPHYTFCTQAIFSEPNTTAGSISYVQRTYFAPDEGDLSKWGWWEQKSTLYYDTGKNYHLFLDVNLALPYYQITGTGSQYVAVTSPAGPGSSTYNSFVYMKNNCTETACDDVQALGCLSNISLAQGTTLSDMVASWYVLAIYIKPDLFAGSDCVQWNISTQFAYMQIYNIELGYKTGDGSFYSNYTTAMVFDITNYSRWFVYSVGPLNMNYYDPSGFGIIVPGLENAAYFVSKTPGQITQAQMELFQSQVTSLGLNGCDSCEFRTFTGC